MRLKSILYGCCVLICLSSPVFAQPEVSKTILDNGLTVLIQELPATETVSIYACIKTGSATEGRHLGKGISHFVEHMLFKGTAKRAVGAIAKEVKDLGGLINASTGHDYTLYTLDLPKGTLPQGVNIISDMLMNSSFDETQLEKERTVVHGEMSLYNDRPARVLSDMVYGNVYTQHPYKHPIIGYPMFFDSITREEIYSYYKEQYVPNNIILSVAGAVNKAEVLALVKKAFNDFKPAGYLQRNLPTEPAQSFKRYVDKYYPTVLFHFSLAYQGVGVRDPDLSALDVLSMALGQGESSRLYQQVYKDKHLVESISSSNFTPQDKGVFEIEGQMSADNLDKVLAQLKNIISDIQQHGLSKPELEKTKRQVLASFIFGNQTSANLATRAAIDEVMTADPNFSRHYVELVKNVTNEDIKRVANQYLKEDALSITVLKPKALAPTAAQEKSAVEKGEIKRIVLDNGLTILLREDNSVLINSIKLFVNGGSRQEDEALGGLAQLTGSVWGQGTTHMSQEQIAMAIEKRGGTLSTDAGYNTLQLNIDVLSEDLDFALDMLEDLVKNPLMPQDAIERERENMLTVLEERQDDIMAFSSKVLLETLYVHHPLHRDRYGNKESLAKITRKDIVNFYQGLMYPNNMVITVFGHHDANQVLAVLKKKFGSLKKGDVKVPLFQEPPQDKTRVKNLHMDKEQALLLMAFQAPMLKDADRFGMEVIEAILGASLSGRLFVKIRDELGQAYTAHASYNPNLDTGTFTLYVLTKPGKIDSVKDIITKELEDLRMHDVSAAELNGAKSYLKGSFRRSLLTNSALAFNAGLDELYGLGHNAYQQFYDKIDAVTPQDLRRIAANYLDILKATIVITEPKTAEAK